MPRLIGEDLGRLERALHSHGARAGDERGGGSGGRGCGGGEDQEEAAL